MKWVRGLLLVVLTMVMAPSPLFAAAPIPGSPTEPPTPVQLSSLKVSAVSLSLVKTSNSGYTVTPYYVELYNDGNVAVNPAEYNLGISDGTASGSFQTGLAKALSDTTEYLPPDEFMVVDLNNAIEGEYYNPKILLGSRDIASTLTVGKTVSYELQLSRGGRGVYAKPVSFKLTQMTPASTTESATRFIYRTVTDDEQRLETSTIYDTTLYAPPVSFPLTPIELVPNPASCSATLTNFHCAEYVKFYNSTEKTVYFDEVRLRTGEFSALSTASNTVNLSGHVESGAYAVFALPLTNTGGSVWLQDRYGVIPYYSNTVVAYPDASAASKKGQSWASFSSGWAWAQPTPGGANTGLPIMPVEPEDDDDGLTPCRSDQFRNPLTNRCKLKSTTTSTLTACAANQFRNPATNRCKLIASATASLTPCRADQFRNPLTNRCKSTTTATNSLVPCKANQFRNPETNRCKSLTSSDSTLKPCQPNQERSPLTNRCRKTAAVLAKASNPVEPYSDSAQQSGSWMAFAAVGSAAAGYGVWEWRREIGGLASKLRAVVGK